MANVSSWSTTAGNNNSTPPDGWPEGMQRSSVNDSARENMAALAKWYKDTNGSLVTAGTSSAYTLTTNAADVALSDTSLLVFRAHVAPSASATLNRDSKGAKALKTVTGTAIPANLWATNQIIAVAYNSNDDSFTVFLIDPVPLTTEGDILYQDSSGLQRLAIGTAAQVLAVNSGATAPEWVDQATNATVETPKATTSGTSVDFTGIPATATRIEIMLSGVSTDGSSPIQFQIGDSGGVETTGYSGRAMAINTSPAVAVGANSTGFKITDINGAGTVYSGMAALTLMDASNNTWVVDGNVGRDSATTCLLQGEKSLSAAMDRIRLTTVNGTDNFDAGSYSIRHF